MLMTLRWTAVLFMTLAVAMAGCSNSDNGGTGASATPPAPTAPTGLVARDESPIYAVGITIVPDTVRHSGGDVTQCTVSPPLAAGLTLDPQTCTISGTPTDVSHATVYTITASNAAGSATTRVEIEVKATQIPPDGLDYLHRSVIYVANAAILPNFAISTGGEITQYSVSPALPAGLVIDPQTGIITGTPTAVTPAATYTVTGANSVDSVQAVITIEVTAQVVPPAGLAYLDLQPEYTFGIPIVYDEPVYTGGEATLFSISPGLPAGLSLNSITGEITGTPAAVTPPTVFTITASNSAGSATAQITLSVVAVPAGGWQPADALNEGRFRHTATPLRDGRVLVAGGSRKQALSSAELYDPATKGWTRTGRLGRSRQAHSATLLADGRVLVAGGFGTGGGNALNSAELYDPATGSWSSTGSLNQARDSHTATLLADGRVLVAGGEGQGSSHGGLASAEIYDPATGTWTPTGSLGQAREQHTATLLANGRVLVAGGEAPGGAALASAELYDPASGTYLGYDGQRHPCP